MQIAANMTVLERACGYFAEFAAKLCGIPARLIEGPHGGLTSRSALRRSQVRMRHSYEVFPCPEILQYSQFLGRHVMRLLWER